jgi:hypothetical protein
MDRRLRAFEFFLRNHPQERLPMARQILEQTDVDILLARTLLCEVRATARRDAYEALLATARARFGGWIDKVVDAADDRARRRSLEELLLRIDGRGPRLVLALAWAGVAPAMALDLVARTFPGEDPASLVRRWTMEITGPRSAADDFAAELGIAQEDDASCLLRELRQRVSRGHP